MPTSGPPDPLALDQLDVGHQVDGCLGDFFSILRARGMYDDSIIIVTSDHGDATGEFGRSSHSLSIYPEVMRVPLLMHLPDKMRGAVVYDESHLSALTDITPSLYYLLGHRPLRSNALVAAQAKHFAEADRNLPPAFRTGIDVNSIATEGEAADYVRKVTEAIHRSGGTRMVKTAG
jgi:arylsulfatase A-like enzyme